MIRLPWMDQKMEQNSFPPKYRSEINSLMEEDGG
jgi:hypothetical protein